MSYYLFHQNMRVFGGGSSNRNTGFDDAMDEIAGAIGADRILVAGFTEVTNKTLSEAAIETIAGRLDPALGNPDLFAVGVTAVGKKVEYIAISVFAQMRSQFKVEHRGRVLRTTDSGWKCFPEDSFRIDLMPKAGFAFQLDSRGLAYVVGTFKRRKMIVGFMHNMYGLGERSGAFQSMTKMSGLIRQAHGLDGKYVFTAGGDWNVRPRKLRRREKRLKTVWAEEGGTPVNTTLKHAYDFWLSEYAGIYNVNAVVFTQSRDVSEGLSDHAAVGLMVFD